jgi:hypothetical protein
MPPLTPEYIAYTNASQIMAITSTFFAIALLVVLLRCYVRITMLKVFGIDDWIMVFAMVRTLPYWTLAPTANVRFRL